MRYTQPHSCVHTYSRRVRWVVVTDSNSLSKRHTLIPFLLFEKLSVFVLCVVVSKSGAIDFHLCVASRCGLAALRICSPSHSLSLTRSARWKSFAFSSVHLNKFPFLSRPNNLWNYVFIYFIFIYTFFSRPFRSVRIHQQRPAIMELCVSVHKQSIREFNFISFLLFSSRCCRCCCCAVSLLLRSVMFAFRSVLLKSSDYISSVLIALFWLHIILRIHSQHERRGNEAFGRRLPPVSAYLAPLSFKRNNSVMNIEQFTWLCVCVWLWVRHNLQQWTWLLGSKHQTKWARASLFFVNQMANGRLGTNRHQLTKDPSNRNEKMNSTQLHRQMKCM